MKPQVRLPGRPPGDGMLAVPDCTCKSGAFPELDPCSAVQCRTGELVDKPQREGRDHNPNVGPNARGVIRIAAEVCGQDVGRNFLAVTTEPPLTRDARCHQGLPTVNRHRQAGRPELAGCRALVQWEQKQNYVLQV